MCGGGGGAGGGVEISVAISFKNLEDIWSGLYKH